MTTTTNLSEKFIQQLNLNQHDSKCGGWTSANPQLLLVHQKKSTEPFGPRVDIIISCFMNK